MVNTISGTAAQSLRQAAPTAVRNVHKSANQTVKLLLVWAAVSVPMAWGVMKALEDVKYLFQ
jgi:hypothetical protein